MTGWRKRMMIVGAIGGLAVTLAVASPAATTRALSLSGTQTIVDESKGVYEMHGSLVGTWYVTSYVPRYQSQTQLAATGKERFVGCLDTNRNTSCDSGEPAGTLSLTYMYWARFKDNGTTLVRGACVHPILGGTKGFANAKGLILMKDTPVGKNVRTTYTGTVELAASVQTSSQRSLSSSSSSRAC